MVDLYLNYNQNLTHEQLFLWHKMISNGIGDLTDIGRYRTHEDPMYVVSGRLDSPKVYFEAPLSKTVSAEMDTFVSWFKHLTFSQSRNNSPLFRRYPRPLKQTKKVIILCLKKAILHLK